MDEGGSLAQLVLQIQLGKSHRLFVSARLNELCLDVLVADERSFKLSDLGLLLGVRSLECLVLHVEVSDALLVVGTLLLHGVELRLHLGSGGLDEERVIVLKLSDLGHVLIVLFLLSGFSLASDLELFLSVLLALSLQLGIHVLKLLLKLLLTLCEVLSQGVDLGGVGLVTALAVVLVELALLGELVGMARIDRLDLLTVGLLALGVQLVQVVNRTVVLLLRFKSEYVLGFQLFVLIRDLSCELLLVGTVLTSLRLELLLGLFKLSLEVLASGLGLGEALVVAGDISLHVIEGRALSLPSAGNVTCVLQLNGVCLVSQVHIGVALGDGLSDLAGNRGCLGTLLSS
jgi:hypothetical protein